MNKFELNFYLGETQYRAEVFPEEIKGALIYTCAINNNIVFKIRKSKQNKWESIEGNNSEMCKLIGWEIDNYLKHQNLRKKTVATRWDINLS